MTSKIDQLTTMCMDGVAEGLAVYHACKAAINASRKKIGRVAAVKHALRHLNVIVSPDGERIRIFKPETGAEYFL